MNGQGQETVLSFWNTDILRLAKGGRMAKAWKYSALLKRAKDIHSEDEGIRFKLKASAWAIEEIEQLKTKTVHQCSYRLKVLNDRQKWLAHQLEEDLLEIEKDAL